MYQTALSSSNMNGLHKKGLNESHFGPESDGTTNVIKSFDAFPKIKPSYAEQTHSGGIWTVALVCVSALLTLSELSRWWTGDTTYTFAVEQGVGHDLQINLDVVLAMQCSDLHINVQDASGDRIFAGETLSRDATLWEQWGRKARRLASTKQERLDEQRSGMFNAHPEEYKTEDVHDYLGAAKRGKKFAKTPRVPWGRQPDSCRIYGTIHTNKVQGDFHITARGHGYLEFAPHLEHNGE